MINRPSKLERIQAARPKKDRLPSWAGEEKRCFACERPNPVGGVSRELRWKAVQRIWFIICEDCLKHCNVDHAWRTFARKLRALKVALTRGVSGGNTEGPKGNNTDEDSH